MELLGEHLHRVALTGQPRLENIEIRRQGGRDDVGGDRFLAHAEPRRVICGTDPRGAGAGRSPLQACCGPRLRACDESSIECESAGGPVVALCLKDEPVRSGVVSSMQRVPGSTRLPRPYVGHGASGVRCVQVSRNGTSSVTARTPMLSGDAPPGGRLVLNPSGSLDFSYEISVVDGESLVHHIPQFGCVGSCRSMHEPHRYSFPLRFFHSRLHLRRGAHPLPGSRKPPGRGQRAPRPG